MCTIKYSTHAPKILYQFQKINGNAVKHNFIILFQKTVLDPIGKFELIFDWELAVKRLIKTLDYTLVIPRVQGDFIVLNVNCLMYLQSL